MNAKEAAPPLFLFKYALFAAAAASAALLAVALFAGETAWVQTLPPASAHPAGKFIRHSEPVALPDIAFKDGEGKPVRLSDWRGRMVLLNIWATWCGPCKKEMASLDRLQAKLGGQEFTVVALSTDRGGPAVAAEFFDREGLRHLKPYNDQAGEAARKIKMEGLPMSIILNKNGQEIARLLGPMEWDSPEIIAQLEAWKAGQRSGREEPRPSL